jgi:hypothetical protein
MVMDFLTQYVIGPTGGGIQISYGALFVILIWFISHNISRLVKKRTIRG